jgi:lipoprotein-anchoring transpeptidase ErfK/SrfK
MANMNRLISYAGAALVLSGVALWTGGAQAQALTWTASQQVSLPNGFGRTSDSGVSPNTDIASETAANLRRQVVDYSTSEAPGVIVVDTPHTYLYFVLGGGKAIRYGIGVGREGFTWSGTNSIERKSEWPDWIPPHEMLGREPYLPRFMAGGEGNPLGARAMYLSGTEYRIHGTNAPSASGSPAAASVC